MATMTVSYLTVDGEILSETRSGTESDYIPDPLGSTADLLNSSQTITDTFTWWPYGELRSHGTGSSKTPFGYVGTLGCYTGGNTSSYIRANVLVPTLARWQTVDSLWPGQKAYSYCRSNPTSLVDPSGKTADSSGVPSWLWPFGPGTIVLLGLGGCAKKIWDAGWPCPPGTANLVNPKTIGDQCQTMCKHSKDRNIQVGIYQSSCMACCVLFADATAIRNCQVDCHSGAANPVCKCP